MSRCGTCRGRGWTKAIRGIGQVECRSCKGSGEKIQRSTLGRDTFTIPLKPGTLCRFCEDRPATTTHHVCPQSRVKKVIPRDLWEEVLTDPRDGIAACRDCHDRAESNPQRVEPHLLHPRFWQWVAEWNLYAVLPRHLSREAV